MDKKNKVLSIALNTKDSSVRFFVNNPGEMTTPAISIDSREYNILFAESLNNSDFEDYLVDIKFNGDYNSYIKTIRSRVDLIIDMILEENSVAEFVKKYSSEPTQYKDVGVFLITMTNHIWKGNGVYVDYQVSPDDKLIIGNGVDFNINMNESLSDFILVKVNMEKFNKEKIDIFEINSTVVNDLKKEGIIVNENTSELLKPIECDETLFEVNTGSLRFSIDYNHEKYRKIPMELEFNKEFYPSDFAKDVTINLINTIISSLNNIEIR